LSETATVGVAGIGRMGLPMARNLLRAGFHVLVRNRTPSRCEPLLEEGAEAVADAATLAAAAVVVTMLTDAEAARRVRVPALTATAGVLEEAAQARLAEADMASVIRLISQPTT
jgi:3-hydroxyisobutyrate dehydrogenase-like beta-hydroxyacid dehydrogenase